MADLDREPWSSAWSQAIELAFSNHFANVPVRFVLGINQSAPDFRVEWRNPEPISRFDKFEPADISPFMEMIELETKKISKAYARHGDVQTWVREFAESHEDIDALEAFIEDGGDPWLIWQTEIGLFGTVLEAMENDQPLSQFLSTTE